MLRQGPRLVLLTTLISLAACSRLFPSDPGPSVAAIRVSNGILAVAIPRCAHNIMSIDLSTSPLAPNPRLIWSSKLNGVSGALVPLTGSAGK